VFLNFGILINVVLLAAGAWWCKVIFERVPKDVAELRRAADDYGVWASIMLLWCVTFFIALLSLNFLVGIVLSVVGALRSP
jgi:hypothetical protein